MKLLLRVRERHQHHPCNTSPLVGGLPLINSAGGDCKQTQRHTQVQMCANVFLNFSMPQINTHTHTICVNSFHWGCLPHTQLIQAEAGEGGTGWGWELFGRVKGERGGLRSCFVLLPWKPLSNLTGTVESNFKMDLSFSLSNITQISVNWFYFNFHF